MARLDLLLLLGRFALAAIAGAAASGGVQVLPADRVEEGAR